MFELVTIGARPALTPAVIFKKVGRHLQGDAAYQISKLYAFHFQRKGILKFFYFVWIFELLTPGAGPLLIPGASYQETC